MKVHLICIADIIFDKINGRIQDGNAMKNSEICFSEKYF